MAKTEPTPEELRHKALRDELEAYRAEHEKPWYLKKQTNIHNEQDKYD